MGGVGWVGGSVGVRAAVKRAESCCHGEHRAGSQWVRMGLH